MATVKRFYKYKGHTIRHVFKLGAWCYDTSINLILYPTLKEAKDAIDDYNKTHEQ